MNDSELMQEVKALNSRIEELEKEFEKVQGKKLEMVQGKKYPDENAIVYIVNGYGEVTYRAWADWWDEEAEKLVKLMFDSGELFLTKEDAEEYAEVKQIERELYALADDTQEWNGISSHYFLYCSHSNMVLHVGYVYSLRENVPYFASKESARAAVKEVGEERVAKWLTYKRTRGNNK